MPNRPSVEVLIARQALSVISKDKGPTYIRELMNGRFDWSTEMVIAIKVVALTLELSDRKPRSGIWDD